MNNILKKCKNINIYYFVLFMLIVIYLHFFPYNDIEEGFTPFLREAYRPHIRNVKQKYNQIIDLYRPDVIITKLKRWSLY
jgi:hypothetical protein